MILKQVFQISVRILLFMVLESPGMLMHTEEICP